MRQGARRPAYVRERGDAYSSVKVYEPAEGSGSTAACVAAAPTRSPSARASETRLERIPFIDVGTRGTRKRKGLRRGR